MPRTTRFPPPRLRASPWVALLVAAAAALPVLATPIDDARADRIFEVLQRERAVAGVGAQRRLAELDTAARQRAATIAALPHAERLAHRASIAEEIASTGLELRRSTMHLDMVRGYDDPTGALLRTWRRYEQAWTTAMDPELDRIGVSLRRADDGWVVLVVAFGAEVPVPDDPESLERQAIEAVNRVRGEHGLEPLATRAELVAAARRHSEDMARHDYFAHRAPDGTEVDDRIRFEGVRFRRVAENIQRNRGHVDPVAVAVQSWMQSARHRETILSPEYVQTGVGVAISADGTVVLTQVFLTPPGTTR